MIKIAHASSIERCKLAIKKAKIAKKKKQQEWVLLDSEKKEEILAARAAPLSSRKQLIPLIWDYKHGQLHTSKRRKLLGLLLIRIDELEKGAIEYTQNEKEYCIKIRGELKNV